jgi:hypothetical protein
MNKYAKYADMTTPVHAATMNVLYTTTFMNIFTSTLGLATPTFSVITMRICRTVSVTDEFPNLGILEFMSTDLVGTG